MTLQQLAATLLAVVIGAALTLVTATILDRRRDLIARGNHLRNAYYRWLALQEILSAEWKILAQLLGRLDSHDTALLHVISQDLRSLRPQILELTHLGNEIVSLEGNPELRKIAQGAAANFVALFASTSGTISGYQLNATLSERAAAMTTQLRNLPRDHPSYDEIAAHLVEIESKLQQQFNALHDSHQDYGTIVELNAKQVDLCRQIADKIAARWRLPVV